MPEMIVKKPSLKSFTYKHLLFIAPARKVLGSNFYDSCSLNGGSDSATAFADKSFN